MTPRAVANEFAKMRRLRTMPVVLALVLGAVALSAPELVAEGFPQAATDPAGLPWQRLLGSMAFAVPLVSPVLLAVLASRQVDIEHQGSGWLASHTAGLPPGRLCRAKFTATGAVVAAAGLLLSGLVIALGVLAGITAAFPIGPWASYTASIVVVNLVLLAGHLLLSAWVPNQLVGLGVAVLGMFVAAIASVLPPWLAHLLPWGYYALATPVDYRGGALVTVAPSHPGVLALAVMATGIFLLVTRALDHREA